jgi:hypothetical protein
MIPPFDVMSGNVWGPVVLIVAVAGTIATSAYFMRGNRRVRVLVAARATPWWYWLVWTLWYCSLLFGASALHTQVPVAYTVAGVASAVPLLARGIRPRGRATT